MGPRSKTVADKIIVKNDPRATGFLWNENYERRDAGPEEG